MLDMYDGFMSGDLATFQVVATANFVINDQSSAAEG